MSDVNPSDILQPMPVRFDILPGLPAYGPPAISFPESDLPTFREGLVVRFHPAPSDAGGDPWVGNFLGGQTSYDRVLAHPNGADVIVVARGHGSVVDVARTSVTASLCDVTQLIPLDALGLVLVERLTDFIAIGADGMRWQSPRISWDGFRSVSISADQLRGEAYSAPDEEWVPFTLDLATGACRDGIFAQDIARAVEVTPNAAPSRRRRHACSASGVIARFCRMIRAWLPSK
ncbi:hypothetical protein SSBR45G_31020 [Bradyrhizobium sp. SSBR45G]|uniref:hypothetical protein n=1 Tax=unclassified Bradyrhizobium TaxID=2631580 RepID=UPI0023429F9A|nr:MULTISPECIES: hypothetical protein [unclassified Bradyrhizobium]GLH78193.1 hypothetical protein SSBR45G_31020 [Bradyrhizobium sp. SSBR45G]GLH86040.1 hypothetical protein SSBR45R_35000 [Bradyrhizobium sp. SSBR45R]